MSEAAEFIFRSMNILLVHIVVVVDTKIRVLSCVADSLQGYRRPIVTDIQIMIMVIGLVKEKLR